ncbi:MAG: T9SS type A sorting domain-containing protein [candidate division KSB1 bacterium]|nr:T9SS type A sorting domain-containing protein [candidate division KSB1 bacterium]
MNKIILMILCLFVTNAMEQQLKASDYFPLRIGNTWVFDLYEWPDKFVLQDTISIIDSLEIDGKTYFLFDHFFTIHRLEDSVYVRTSADKVYRYYDGREELWFDLGANEGDSWLIKTHFVAEDTLVPVKVSLDKKNYSFSVNNRKLENCYFFGFDFAVDYGWTYLLAPKIGCVYSDVISILPRWYSFRNGVINDIAYPDLVTSVDSKNKPKHDAISRSMLSVYPNPFNSSARIALNMPRAEGRIDPEIYICDIRGRKVKTFSITQATSAEINWNGIDERGIILPSGVYFVVLNFNNKQVTKKVVFTQ